MVDTAQIGEKMNTNPYPCRKCGRTIYWHRAQSGRNYPCDSPTDRKAFHQCGEPAAALAKPEPVQTQKPITPDYFEATLEQRVESLEKQYAQLNRAVLEIQKRMPIDMSDVGF